MTEVDSLNPIAEFWTQQVDKWTPDPNDHPLFRNSPQDAIAIKTAVTKHWPDLKYRARKMPGSNWGADIGSASSSSLYLPPQVLDKTIAIDSSEVMLSQSQAAKTVVSDARKSLEFLRDGELAFATSFLLFRYLTFSEQVRLTQEIIRVLEPRGKFIIIDFTRLGMPHESVDGFNPFKIIRAIPEFEQMIDVEATMLVPANYDNLDVGQIRGPLYLLRGITPRQ